MTAQRIGFALCGSFCTFDKALASLESICRLYTSVTPIMSENAYETDSRFGTAQSYIEKIETLCGKKVLKSIAEVEPIGPKGLLDLLIIAPCTGNTLAKLAHGVTNTSVTMAAKAHLRNGRPVLIAVSTNDGLSGNAANFGALLERKLYYFVPVYQDDPVHKPCSIVADFDKLPEAAGAALEGQQLQPLLCRPSEND